jgi:hypothetical protein
VEFNILIMQKKLTTNPSTIVTLLQAALPQKNGQTVLQIPAVSHHFVDRLVERVLSGSQASTLGQIAKGSLTFMPSEVSEIRFIEADGKAMPVSIVVNDVVMGVHPLNMDRPLGEFGLREGKGTAIAKTVLSRPNSRHKGYSVLDGWRVEA